MYFLPIEELAKSLLVVHINHSPIFLDEGTFELHIMLHYHHLKKVHDILYTYSSLENKTLSLHKHETYHQDNEEVFLMIYFSSPKVTCIP